MSTWEWRILNGKKLGVIENKLYFRKTINVYLSPYASDEQNTWLMKWLTRVYKLYYWRVSGDNLFHFFKKGE